MACATAFASSSGNRHRGERALGGDRHVERRAGAEDQAPARGRAGSGRARALHDPADGLTRSGRCRTSFAYWATSCRSAAPASADEPWRLARRAPSARRPRHRARHGRAIEQHVGKRDAGRAVQHGMMDLHVEADLSGLRGLRRRAPPTAGGCGRAVARAARRRRPRAAPASRAAAAARAARGGRGRRRRPPTHTGLANRERQRRRAGAGRAAPDACAARSAASRRRRSRRRSPSGRSQTWSDATCIGVSGVSRWRKSESSPDSGFNLRPRG